MLTLIRAAMPPCSLAARAARVFPGGKHTRLPLQAVPGPQFLSHGDGCRVVDSEGREWIDYLAGFGANVLRTLGGALVLVGYDAIKKLMA